MKLIDRKLTPKQTRLVDIFVTEGGTMQQAAEKAGYAPGNSAISVAARTFKQPHVQAYMAQRIREEMSTLSVKALNRVANLVDGAKSEYVQLEASKDLLDRAGFKPIDRSQVQLAGDIKVTIDLSG